MLDALQLAADQGQLVGGVGVGPVRWSICTSELIEVSGLPTSWAMPAASRPNAAIFSWCSTCACASCSSRVRSAMRASSWAWFSLQGGVEPAEVIADALEQQRQGVAGPRHPAQDDERQQNGVSGWRCSAGRAR